MDLQEYTEYYKIWFNLLKNTWFSFNPQFSRKAFEIYSLYLRQKEEFIQFHGSTVR